jgi:monoamine oxidase
VPPKAEGGIRFIPPLPQKEAALRHLEMGHVIKLAICFKGRFWETKAQFGFIHSFNEDFPTWWNQEPITSNCLIAWAGGPAAKRLRVLYHDELLDRAIHSLSRIFGLSERDLRHAVEQVCYHDWSKYPFSRGAYSYPKIGGLDAARVLAEPLCRHDILCRRSQRH